MLISPRKSGGKTFVIIIHVSWVQVNNIFRVNHTIIKNTFYLLLTALTVVHAGNSDNDLVSSQLEAVSVSEAPVVDGNVIDDPVWETAPVATSFTQQTPDEGEGISEKTEVRIMYSSDALYVAVVCYDTEPERIVVSDTRRDASLKDSDSFRFILDTFYDKQNGFIFGTNPAGIEYDAQVNKEGQGGFNTGRQSVGAGGAFNLNWDAVWEVQTVVGDFGWSAEFSIPFKTLRFKEIKEQQWGINFERVIARKQEDAYWMPIPRQFNINRVSLAGTLTGLVATNPRNLKIMPYGLGQSTTGTKGQSQLGLDAKYSLTSSLTLDVTYNTDFAQVEADEKQINLDRFSLFFPEKRPFFLENAGLFSVGEPTYYGPDIEMFFSRRIGIGPDGSSVPILGGARVTGTAGGLNIGVLNMQTESVEGVTDGNNFSVARLRKELPNKSAVGFIRTNRQGLGDSGDYNRVWAVDGQIGIGEVSLFKSFIAQSQTPGIDSEAYAYLFEGVRESKRLLLQLRYTEVGENFNPEMGFLERQGYRKWLFRILNRTRPADLFGLMEIRPHITYWGYWKLDGFQQTGFLHVDSHWEWRNGYRIDTGINFPTEGVEEAFEISKGVMVPAGSYHHREIHIRTNTNLSKPLSVTIVTRIGGFFGGDRRNFDTTIRYRFGDRFTSDLISKYNDVYLPGGNFLAHLLRGRLTYSFSPKVYIQSLFQYNNQTDQWSMNWRFIWQRSASTGLYLVYNQTQDLDGIPLPGSTRSVVIKYSHLFDALK